MNHEQVGGIIRAVLAFLGGFIASKGWFPVELVNEIIGALAVIAAAVWSYWTKTTPQMVAVVNERSEVQGVIIKPTPAGLALANSIPSKSVAVAGTVNAAMVADKRS